MMSQVVASGSGLKRLLSKGAPEESSNDGIGETSDNKENKSSISKVQNDTNEPVQRISNDKTNHQMERPKQQDSSHMVAEPEASGAPPSSPANHHRHNHHAGQGHDHDNLEAKPAAQPANRTHISSDGHLASGQYHNQASDHHETTNNDDYHHHNHHEQSHQRPPYRLVVNHFKTNSYNPRELPTTSNISENQFTRNCVLSIGLTLSSCLILGLIFYLVYNYCKRLRKLKREKQQKPTDFSRFLKNGNLSIISQNLKCNSKTKKHPLDSKQLTINMEGADDSSDDNESTNSKSSSDTNKLANQQQKNGGNKQRSSDGKSSRKHKRRGRKSLGQLRFSLNYDFERSILAVSILEARDLPEMDLCGSSDPYVKVQLMTANNGNNIGNSTYKTRVHKRTLNPVFNETFEFPVNYADLNSKTLIMSVFDHDRFSRHDEIGQVSLQIGSIDLAETLEQWAPLRPRPSQSGPDSAEQLGDICLSLRYVPTAGKLTVVIMEARHLKKMDLAGLSDPYVKLALISSEGKRLKKKKTSIKKCTLNPHYNESFSFEVPFGQIQSVQLVVTVVDYDRIGTSEPIGRIVLGCERTTGESELRHWMDMVASPRRPIAQWHSLKELDYSYQTSNNTTIAK